MNMNIFMYATLFLILAFSITSFVLTLKYKSNNMWPLNTSNQFINVTYPPPENLVLYEWNQWNFLSNLYKYNSFTIKVSSSTGTPELRLTSDGPNLGSNVTIKQTSIYLYMVNFSSIDSISFRANLKDGTSVALQLSAPCFLKGSLVQMFDNTQKNIEDVCIGDKVVGAFNEINTVIALHRPLLGPFLMCHINNEHFSSNHHPHVSENGKFYCGEPLELNGAYNNTHTVLIEKNGSLQESLMFLRGLKNERVLKFELGIKLKTLEGSKELKTYKTVYMPPNTQLYNLVTSGSHTYHVDGYAVTGWPREDDFNYDTWSN